MEIFNVSIPELMLIAGLALVVFGPERLPEVGRFLGKQVARVLAWQQNSPELQMLNDVRGEFEREIASLRDELVRTRKQLDVSQDITAIKEELRPMLDLRGTRNGAAASGAPAAPPPAEPTIAPPSPADSMSPVEVTAPGDQAGMFDVTSDPDSLDVFDVKPAPASLGEPAAISPTPAAQTVPAAARPTKIAATQPTNVLAPPAPPAPPPAASEDAPQAAAASDDGVEIGAGEAEAAESEARAAADAQLARRLHQLVADMQALVSELQERGHLGPDWQPPSQAPQQEAVSR